ncbi:MAG: glycosyltransferase family 4 protein [Actinomycetota bacterium]
MAIPDTLKKITMIAGGFQPQYVVEVVNALARAGAKVDLIGSEDFRGYKYDPGVKVLYYRGKVTTITDRIKRIFLYPIKLFIHSLHDESEVYHIQWCKNIILEGLMLCLYLKLIGKAVVYTAHNVLPHDKEHLLVNRVFYRLLYRTVNAIIVHTESTKKEIIAYAGLPDAKVTVCEHGLYTMVNRLEKESAKKELGLKYKNIVLFFGALSHYKGVDILLKAIKEIRDSKDFDDSTGFVIAGRGLYGKDVDNISREYKSVTPIVQYVDNSTADRLFSAADCIVMPYRKIDQSGVLLLALSYGLPVIASNVGSFKDYIVDGRNGYIYEPNESHALINAIKKFMAKNVWERDLITADAYKKYSWNDIIVKYLKIYINVSAKGNIAGHAN